MHQMGPAAVWFIGVFFFFQDQAGTPGVFGRRPTETVSFNCFGPLLKHGKARLAGFLVSDLSVHTFSLSTSLFLLGKFVLLLGSVRLFFPLPGSCNKTQLFATMPRVVGSFFARLQACLTVVGVRPMLRTNLGAFDSESVQNDRREFQCWVG